MCRICRRLANGKATKKYYESNRSERAEYLRGYRKRSDRRTKLMTYQVNHDLRRSYGLTLAQYQAMWDAQKGRCAVCNRHQVDHCHRTGKIRGLLCGNCNAGLGNFRDSEDLMNAAIRYLKGDKPGCP